MEPPFLAVEGVIRVSSGYTGGHTVNPTYHQVCQGGTGHYESIRIWFDPKVCDYTTLLNVFWRNIDPTQSDGQFADRGSHYKTAIFYYDQAQREAAVQSRAQIALDPALEGKPIATEILPAGPFYPAEDYHQQYFLKNPNHYNRYSEGSGRKAFIRQTWGSTE